MSIFDGKPKFRGIMADYAKTAVVAAPVAGSPCGYIAIRICDPTNGASATGAFLPDQALALARDIMGAAMALQEDNDEI